MGKVKFQADGKITVRSMYGQSKVKIDLKANLLSGPADLKRAFTNQSGRAGSEKNNRSNCLSGRSEVRISQEKLPEPTNSLVRPGQDQ